MKLIMAVVPLLLFSSLIAASADGGRLQSVPEAWRVSLTERLRKLEAYEQTGQWDSAFMLISKRGTQESRSQFVQRMSKYPDKLLFFELSESRKSQVEGEQWFLFGHIVIKTANGPKCYEGMVVANRDKGNWYFRPIVESVLMPLDGSPVECGSGSVEQRESCQGSHAEKKSDR